MERIDTYTSEGRHTALVMGNGNSIRVGFTEPERRDAHQMAVSVINPHGLAVDAWPVANHVVFDQYGAHKRKVIDHGIRMAEAWRIDVPEDVGMAEVRIAVLAEDQAAANEVARRFRQSHDLFEATMIVEESEYGRDVDAEILILADSNV